MCIRKMSIAVVMGICLISCSDSTDIAKVNGNKISKLQYENYLEFKRLSSKEETQKEALLNQYLEREALAGVIEKEGGLDNQKIQTELNEFKKEMLISRYFEDYLKEHITDDAVRNYYTNHSSEFEKKKVHVAHVLIRTNKAMSDIERKAKLTTAQDAYSKVMAHGDFGKIVQTYSEDKVSAVKGGDLGWINEGSINPTFSKRAFELKKDEVSEPVETPLGYHILKILDEPKVIRQPFESVDGNIRYQLRNKAKKAEMDRLMGKTKIKRYK